MSPLSSHSKMVEYSVIQILHFFQNGAMTPKEVSEQMGLSDLEDRKWRIQGSCAVNGNGLCEGLEWIATTVKEIKNNQHSSSFF